MTSKMQRDGARQHTQFGEMESASITFDRNRERRVYVIK